MSNNATRKPIAALTNIERPNVSDEKIDWDQIDGIVQAELAAIDRAILSSPSSIRIRGGSTHGRTWHLFSYRAFEPQPETGIDPVIAGLTFAAAKESNTFLISGDISGESLGDSLLEVPRQEVTGPTAVIAAARAMSRNLVAGSDKIGAALRDRLRRQYAPRGEITMANPSKYVLQGSFDVAPETWATAKEEIRGILVGKARQRAMIPYSELVGLVKTVTFNAFDPRLFAILGQISVAEHEQGRPLLSILVVHKTGDKQPGEGFFELAEALGRNTSDVLKAWIEELNKVYQYWNKGIAANR